MFCIGANAGMNEERFAGILIILVSSLRDGNQIIVGSFFYKYCVPNGTDKMGEPLG